MIFLTIYYKTLFLGDLGQTVKCSAERGGIEMDMQRYNRHAGVDSRKKQKSRNRGWMICWDG